MKTRVTELLGIEHPIILSGMSWISTPEMVAAVSNAGGLGLLATGALNAKETREAVKKIRTLTDKPFGANASLLFPGAAENAAVLLEEKVPVINFSLGKGDWIVNAANEYGGKVLATVTNARHAKRAQDYGCHGVIVTGNEAAAHGEPPTTFCLVPSVADIVDIPVIAAGGVGDGRGLAAVLALGGEGVAMGTRLMATVESPLHNNFKKLSIEKDVYDTLYSRKFDGLWCRIQDTPAARQAVKHGLFPFGYLKAIPNSHFIAKQIGLPYWKLFIGVLASGWSNAKQLAYMANAFKQIRVATESGDIEKGVLPVGQVQGLMHDIPTVQELMDRTVKEAEDVINGLTTKVG
ncbi:MAG: NAD(P)H-dependent flavin oxidoreductase [Candidatus Geothermincolia bacterium]